MFYQIDLYVYIAILDIIKYKPFIIGKCENYIPEIGAVGGGDESLADTGYAESDPTQIAARALLCFNDRYVSDYAYYGFNSTV